MLRKFAIVVMLAVPAAAAAQGEGHRARPAEPLSSTLGVPFPPLEVPFPRMEVPFPRIAVPLPRIEVPLAPLGLRPPAQTNQHIRNRPFERQEREEREQREFEHRQRPVFYGWPAVIYVPQYYVTQPVIQIAVPAPLTAPPALEAPGEADKVAVAAPPAPPPPVPVTHKTFYIIPGCYLGDVPPKDASLPPTCDVGKARTFQP